MTNFDNLLSAYWDAAYAEGKDGRTNDTRDYAAQTALNNIRKALAIRDLLAQAKALNNFSYDGQLTKRGLNLKSIELIHQAKALKENNK